MGGRGSTSMSGSVRKTSASSVAGGPVAKMSDRQLESQLQSVNADMEKASDVMRKTADGHTGYLQGTPWGSRAEHEAYVEAFDTHRSLMARRDAIVDELARRNHERAASQRPEPKTFVNSFGEVTHRYITTSTYERAQKRLDKAVLRNMGY